MAGAPGATGRLPGNERLRPEPGSPDVRRESSRCVGDGALGAAAVCAFDGVQSRAGVRRGLVELGGRRLALESGERLLARSDGRGGLLAPGRVEVVARANRGKPFLMAGEVDVGFLELGVRG